MFYHSDGTKKKIPGKYVYILKSDLFSFNKNRQSEEQFSHES